MMNLVRGVGDLEKLLCALLLALMATVMGLNVLLVQFTDLGLAWASEAILTMFAFFIWIGISYGFKERKHIRASVVTDLLPIKVRTILAIVVDLIVLVFFVLMVVFGIQWMVNPAVVSQTSLLLDYPMWLLYLSAPLGAALSVVRIVQNAVTDLRALRAEPEVG